MARAWLRPRRDPRRSSGRSLSESTPWEPGRTATFGELLGADAPVVKKASAVIAYADALALWKASPASGRPAILQRALDVLAAAEAVHPGDPDLAEIRQVLQKL